VQYQTFESLRLRVFYYTRTISCHPKKLHWLNLP